MAAVEFIVQMDDLRQATSQLKANRGQRTDTDFVDILASDSTATFHAVGSETEVFAIVTHPGSVRIPLRIVEKINTVVKTWKKTEVPFHCETGVIKLGSFSVSHPDIELGRVPDQRLGLPINVSVLDTLALAEVLTAEQIVEEGMRARIEEAIQTRSLAVVKALAALQPLDMTERQLQGLVDSHIKEAAKRLRKSFRAA